MMSFKKGLLVISMLMICVMLSACGTSLSSATEEIPPNVENIDVNLTNLHELAQLYEEVAFGEPICEGTSKSFIMRLVEYLGAEDKCVKNIDGYDTFTMPTEEISKILSLFIVNQFPVETFFYEDDVYSVYSHDIILEPFNIDIDNDEIKLLYGRFVEDKNGLKHWLYPVQYTMSTYTINESEIPDILKDYLKDGEMGFRIKSVENVNNMKSAKEIYCNNGYESMFEEKNYVISSVNDFSAMAERVNNSMYNEIHATYTLACDLDMTGIDFTPIGNCEYFYPAHNEINPVDYGFCGTFNGNNHTISNLRYVPTVYKSDGRGPENYLGMFARLGEGSIVRDLNLNDAYIDYVKDKNYNETSMDYIYISSGILSAYFCGTIIENCNVNGTVKGITGVGGLVGNANGGGSIINCHSDADVYGETWVGGLIGDNSDVQISNCTAKGTVSGDKLSPRSDMDMPMGIGGFVGRNTSTIENCGANVWVKTMVNCRCVGSFAGMNDRQIINCIYNSTIGNWNPIGESYVYSSEVDDAIGYQREEYYEKLKDVIGVE